MRWAGDSLVSKSVDGNVAVWKCNPWTIDHWLHIPDGGRCIFDVSIDGTKLCTGTECGTVLIYDLHSTTILAQLQHRHARSPVAATLFSHDARSVICVGPGAHLLRWDQIDSMAI